MDDIRVLYIEIPNSKNVIEAAAWIDKNDEDAHYTLVWTDFVANAWTETYEDLGAAIARIALLAEAGAQDWAPSFSMDAPAWSRMWDTVTSEALS